MVDWARRQASVPMRGVFGMKDYLAILRGLWKERAGFRTTRGRIHYAVSEAVARDISQTYNVACGVLPNCYDSSVYNPAARVRYRDLARKNFNLPSNSLVFSFVSNGHYRRKGFFEAVDILARVRGKCAKSIQFLVIGGTELALRHVKRWLDRHHAGWASWIQFTGMKADIITALSAADAFLFPSYSEAFALVEIEAAALGLRLYLTPHHGSEMILENEANGMHIPWNTEECADTICADIHLGLVTPTGTPSLGKALTVEQYAHRLREVLDSRR